MKAFLDFARILWYALRSTSDGCNYVLRLVPTNDLKPCDEENKHRTPPHNLQESMTKLFKQNGCFTDILIDAEALAEGLAATQTCVDIMSEKANKVEEFDIVDGKTTIDTTIDYAAYVLAGENYMLSLNGKEINESSVPQSVTLVDNGGLVQIVFSAPIGGPNDPCDVKGVIWTKEIISVIACN